MSPPSSSSSPYAACFRPSAAADHSLPPPSPPMSAHSNLTTCLYDTHLAAFSLSFSRSVLSRSFLLHSPHLSSSSFNLHLNPFAFWKRSGSKKLSPTFHLFWDFSRARFGSRPEPRSGFYIAVVVSGEMTLLVGDLIKEAYAKTKALKPQTPQSLVLKTEQVVAHKVYSTTARIAGKVRDIQIDCGYNDDTRLCFSVDGERVLQVKHLKWKFRGNEKVEVDGVAVQISWDVYNWMFEEEREDNHAIFMFRVADDEPEKTAAEIWSMRMRKSSSSSSISLSSAGSSSAGSSSVLEWATVEESELCGGPSGFSLLVYAWKK